MRLNLDYTSQFQRDIKRALRIGGDLAQLDAVVALIEENSRDSRAELRRRQWFSVTRRGHWAGTIRPRGDDGTPAEHHVRAAHDMTTHP